MRKILYIESKKIVLFSLGKLHLWAGWIGDIIFISTSYWLVFILGVCFKPWEKLVLCVLLSALLSGNLQDPGQMDHYLVVVRWGWYFHLEVPRHPLSCCPRSQQAAVSVAAAQVGWLVNFQRYFQEILWEVFVNVLIHNIISTLEYIFLFFRFSFIFREHALWCAKLQMGK